MEEMGAANGRDGSGQWKRWERPMEEMGAANGRDGSGQWKRWERPMERSRVSGVPRWERPVETLPCFSCKKAYWMRGMLQFFLFAYVVYVVFNVFVLLTLEAGK
jgi:hypothetical protein